MPQCTSVPEIRCLPWRASHESASRHGRPAYSPLDPTVPLQCVTLQRHKGFRQNVATAQVSVRLQRE